MVELSASKPSPAYPQSPTALLINKKEENVNTLLQHFLKVPFRSYPNFDRYFAMCPTNGNNIRAISRFMPVCAIAIRSVSPLGMPSETKNPASQIVPVVPILAPSTHAMAAGRGTAPVATKAMIAVVDRDDDCHRRVITIPPKNI